MSYIKFYNMVLTAGSKDQERKRIMVWKRVLIIIMLLSFIKFAIEPPFEKMELFMA